MTHSEYLSALKREADRERSWRKSRQGAFESSMLSLDAHVRKFDDPGKIAAFSDGGIGAARVRGAASRDPTVVDAALAALTDRDRAFAWAVLSGCGWHELGLTRQGFNFKIRSLERKLSLRWS